MSSFGTEKIAAPCSGARVGGRQLDADAIRSLQALPGVGPSIARDLVDLVILRPEELAGLDPDRLYDDLCTLRGEHIDRCVKYVFRCAHYAVTTDRADPELLKWWSWTDQRVGGK